MNYLDFDYWYLGTEHWWLILVWWVFGRGVNYWFDGPCLTPPSPQCRRLYGELKQTEHILDSLTLKAFQLSSWGRICRLWRWLVRVCHCDPNPPASHSSAQNGGADTPNLNAHSNCHVPNLLAHCPPYENDSHPLFVLPFTSIYNVLKIIIYVSIIVEYYNILYEYCYFLESLYHWGNTLNEYYQIRNVKKSQLLYS